MKQVEHQAFDQFVAAHPEGTELQARVTKVQAFGAFCELAPGVEGLLEVIDFDGGPRPMVFPDDYPRVGDSLGITIDYVNRDARKIRLTQRRSGGAA